MQFDILTGVIISHWSIINKHLFSIEVWRNILIFPTTGFLFTFPPVLHPVTPEISRRKLLDEVSSLYYNVRHQFPSQIIVWSFLSIMRVTNMVTNCCFLLHFWEIVFPLICTNLMNNPVRMWKAGTKGVLTSDIEVLLTLIFVLKTFPLLLDRTRKNRDSHIWILQIHLALATMRKI